MILVVMTLTVFAVAPLVKACSDPGCGDWNHKDLRGFMKLACSDPGCGEWKTDPTIKDVMKLACDSYDCYHHPEDLQDMLKLACNLPGCGNGWKIDPELKSLGRMQMAAADTGLKFMGTPKSLSKETTADMEKKVAAADKGLSWDVIEANAKDAPTVTKILSMRIPVNGKDDQGRTLLMFAAAQGNAEGVKMLLSKKADVKVMGKKGDTALMWAAYEGNREVVQALLLAGADPNRKNERGHSAKYWAEKQKHVDVIKLFEAAGVGD
ncbi:ankyrin repeat domain-containing protein [Thermodesulfobacteriota bacterium]